MENLDHQWLRQGFNNRAKDVLLQILEYLRENGNGSDLGELQQAGGEGRHVPSDGKGISHGNLDIETKSWDSHGPNDHY